jgi:hypothetical protein
VSSWLSLSKEDTSSGRWLAALGQRRGVPGRCDRRQQRTRLPFFRQFSIAVACSAQVALAISPRARVVFSAICWIVLEQRQSRQR